MKKLILFTFLFSIISLTIKAQEGTTFGIKGGINISNFTSSSFSKFSSKTGIYFGGIVEFSLKNKFSIQSEILYSKQGSNSVEFYYGGTSQNFEFTLDYIQIPVLAKFYIYKNISLELGPSFNFLLNDKGVNKSDTNRPTQTDFGKETEFSGIIGATYKLKNNFFTSARYVKGFTESMQDRKNSSFQIGIGYMF